MLISPTPLWAFFGLFAGGWKTAILAGAAAAFFAYGTRVSPFVRRWLSLRAHTRGRPPVAPPARADRSFGDRLFLLLLVMAATAVATWILARATITGSH